MTNRFNNRFSLRRHILSMGLVAVTLFAATAQAQDSTLSPELKMLVDSS